MIKKTIGYIANILKSPIIWILSLGVLSDLGISFSDFTNNSIERIGVIIADIINVITG